MAIVTSRPDPSASAQPGGADSLIVEDAVASRHAKYATGNPFAKWLIRRFSTAARKLLDGTAIPSLLDVGCGEAIFLREVGLARLAGFAVAVDIDPVDVTTAKRNAPWVACGRASAYALPFGAASFDTVTCFEVLEHLEEPRRALVEIRRIARRHCVLSVPNEPLWRVLNLVRGSYLDALGNTPGHLQHWRPRAFVREVERYFTVQRVIKPLPWVCVHATV